MAPWGEGVCQWHLSKIICDGDDDDGVDDDDNNGDCGDDDYEEYEEDDDSDDHDAAPLVMNATGTVPPSHL